MDSKENFEEMKSKLATLTSEVDKNHQRFEEEKATYLETASKLKQQKMDLLLEIELMQKQLNGDLHPVRVELQQQLNGLKKYIK